MTATGAVVKASVKNLEKGQIKMDADIGEIKINTALIAEKLKVGGSNSKRKFVLFGGGALATIGGIVGSILAFFGPKPF